MLPRALRVAMPLALASLLAWASLASAHICVAFLISIGGPHVHVLC